MLWLRVRMKWTSLGFDPWRIDKQFSESGLTFDLFSCIIGVGGRGLDEGDRLEGILAVFNGGGVDRGLFF